MKSHYDPLSDDVTFKLGNTTVTIIAPRITKEENERRWKHFCEVASEMARNMIRNNEL